MAEPFWPRLDSKTNGSTRKGHAPVAVPLGTAHPKAWRSECGLRGVSATRLGVLVRLVGARVNPSMSVLERRRAENLADVGQQVVGLVEGGDV
jgi:hypothetical protein